MAIVSPLFFSNIRNQMITGGNLYLAGIILAIGGSLSSWWCRGDFVNVCTPGLKVNLTLPSLQINSEQLIMVLIMMVIVGLFFQALTSIQARKIFIISISILGIVYLVVNNGLIFEDNGGLLIILLSIIAAWLIIRWAKVISHPDRVMIIGIIMALVSGNPFIQALARQAAEKHLVGGFTVEVGFPVVLIGSLLILLTGIVREIKKLRFWHSSLSI
jgi:hypothetical protein